MYGRRLVEVIKVGAALFIKFSRSVRKSKSRHAAKRAAGSQKIQIVGAPDHSIVRREGILSYSLRN
jgi:hypothetical protein